MRPTPSLGDRRVSDAPSITRVRHELRRRRLRVSRVERLAPHMARIVFQGADLQGFTSPGFDDHVKLFFPAEQRRAATPADAPPGAAPVMRDFTPRKYDAQGGELWIDFHLHASGPAAQWAEQAAVGQTLDIAGPKGSAIIALEDIDAHVLIGDESALPAIGRRLEELPPTSRALVLLELDEDADMPELCSQASLEVHRVTRHSRGTAPPFARGTRHWQGVDQGGGLLATRQSRHARTRGGGCLKNGDHRRRRRAACVASRRHPRTRVRAPLPCTSAVWHG
jgi:NADPH-dependent ferric siderophore reductase